MEVFSRYKLWQNFLIEAQFKSILNLFDSLDGTHTQENEPFSDHKIE